MSSVTRTVLYREVSAALFTRTRYFFFAAYFAFSSALFCSVLQLGEGKFWSLQTLWTLSVALPMPILVSLVTMPLFAGERSAGTFESLSMLPIPMRKVVIGKFVATYLSVLLALLGSVVPWLFLTHTLKNRAPDPLTLIAPFLLIALHSFSWTALGTLSSALSRRPWLAAVGTLFFGAAFMLLWAVVSHFWFSGNLLSSSFPIIRELLDASGGHISLTTIVFHISFGVCALFISSQFLEVRR